MLVNPKHAAVDGEPCHPDVASLPETPDLAVIATPPDAVPGLVAALGARGTKAAVVVTAGFGEGAAPRRRALRQAMLDAARPHLLRIVGPNCLGIMVPGRGLNATFAHLGAQPGKLAFVTQSGAVARASSTGPPPATSASPTWSRSATWPTSTSATCSTTWPWTPRPRPSSCTSRR